MRCIETVNAQGHVLCHDITVIVRGVKKVVAFKQGHVVTAEDIPELLRLGEGGLCLNCEVCTYPNCGFGK